MASTLNNSRPTGSVGSCTDVPNSELWLDPLACRDEPSIDEHAQDLLHVRGLLASRRQIADTNAAACVLGPRLDAAFELTSLGVRQCGCNTATS
jgi:hypothetical protein